MRIRLLLLIAATIIITAGCNTATNFRDSIATSFGYLTWAQTQYGTSCKANPQQTVCTTINKGIALNNLAIDALEAYCNGTPAAGAQSFTNGGACVPINSLQAALSTAVANLNQIIVDVKALVPAPPKATTAIPSGPPTWALAEDFRI